MKNKIGIISTILLIIVVVIGILSFNQEKSEIRTIKSEKELEKIYQGEDTNNKNILMNILCMPFSFFFGDWYYYDTIDEKIADSNITIDSAMKSEMGETTSAKNDTSSTSSKDYFTTNIQVENVDEADITKTDGDYIYSISEDNVIITNVKNPNSIEIASRIKAQDRKYTRGFNFV